MASPLHTSNFEAMLGQSRLYKANSVYQETRLQTCCLSNRLIASVSWKRLHWWIMSCISAPRISLINFISFRQFALASDHNLLLSNRHIFQRRIAPTKKCLLRSILHQLPKERALIFVNLDFAVRVLHLKIHDHPPAW